MARILHAREDHITKSTTVHQECTTKTPAEPLRRGRALSFRLMRKTAYTIPQMGVVVCRLWRISPRGTAVPYAPQYALELAGLGQRRMRSVGKDLRRAEEIAALLEKHTVTPCSLFDVLEDLTEEGENP